MMSGNVAAIANTSGKHCSMKMCPFKAVNPSRKANFGTPGSILFVLGSKYMSRNR